MASLELFEPQSAVISNSKDALNVFLNRARRVNSIYKPLTNFKGKSDDVFISTFPKCGTTWMQQIVHQLRTGGDNNFTAISSVVPFLRSTEMWPDYSNDVTHNMRAFKTHLQAADALVLGGKHIYIVRDPYETLISHWHFVPNSVNIDASQLTIEDYYYGYYTSLLEPTYWKNLAGWYKHRLDTNLLWVHFEDLLKDRSTVIKKVANFIGIDCSSDLLQLVVDRSSYEYMKGKVEFDDVEDMELIMKLAGVHSTEERNGLSGKLRKNKTKANQYIIPSYIKTHMEQMWNWVVYPSTGLKNYKELYEQCSIFK